MKEAETEERTSVLKKAARDVLNFLKTLPKYEEENNNDIVDINDPKNFSPEENETIKKLFAVQAQINNKLSSGNKKGFKEQIRTNGEKGGSGTILRTTVVQPSKEDRIRS